MYTQLVQRLCRQTKGAKEAFTYCPLTVLMEDTLKAVS